MRTAAKYSPAPVAAHAPKASTYCQHAPAAQPHCAWSHHTGAETDCSASAASAVPLTRAPRRTYTSNGSNSDASAGVSPVGGGTDTTSSARAPGGTANWYSLYEPSTSFEVSRLWATLSSSCLWALTAEETIKMAARRRVW